MLEGLGALHQLDRRLGGAPLNPEPAQGVNRLGGQADVAHDRNLGRNQGFDHQDSPGAPLQFHGLRAGADEPGGIADGVLGRHVVTQPRQVGHDEGVGLGPGNSRGVMNHVVDGDAERVRVAQDHHRQGITHQQHVDAGRIGQSVLPERRRRSP